MPYHASAMHVSEAKKTMTQDQAWVLVEFNSLGGDAILIWPQAMITTTTTIKLLEQGIAHDGECNYRLYSIQRFLDAFVSLT